MFNLRVLSHPYIIANQIRRGIWENTTNHFQHKFEVIEPYISSYSFADVESEFDCKEAARKRRARINLERKRYKDEQVNFWRKMNVV